MIFCLVFCFIIRCLSNLFPFIYSVIKFILPFFHARFVILFAYKFECMYFLWAFFQILIFYFTLEYTAPYIHYVLLWSRLEWTAFINEKEEFNVTNKSKEESLNSFQTDSTKGQRGLEKEVDKKVVEGGRKSERLGRGVRDFNRVYRASREVVLQSLLLRAGVRNLGPGSHHVRICVYIND